MTQPDLSTLPIFAGQARVLATASDGEPILIALPQQVYQTSTQVVVTDRYLKGHDEVIVEFGGASWSFADRPRLVRSDSEIFVRLALVQAVLLPRWELRPYVPRGTKDRRFRIALDFDSVLHADPDNFTKCEVIEGHANPNVIHRLIDYLNDQAVVVVLHTCRLTHADPRCPEHTSSPHEVTIEAVRRWLLEQGVSSAGVDRLEYWTGVGKPSADVYVDDKAFAFRGHLPSAAGLREYLADSKAARTAAGCR